MEQAYIEEMARTQIRTDRATPEHIRKVHDALSPAQQARYETKVRECLHSACPHHQHHDGLEGKMTLILCPYLHPFGPYRGGIRYGGDHDYGVFLPQNTPRRGAAGA